MFTRTVLALALLTASAAHAAYVIDNAADGIYIITSGPCITPTGADTMQGICDSTRYLAAPIVLGEEPDTLQHNTTDGYSFTMCTRIDPTEIGLCLTADVTLYCVGSDTIFRDIEP